MRRAGWGVALAALLGVAVLVGCPTLREKRGASAQQRAGETQQTVDQPGPGGGGSPWWSSVVPTTGKPNQVVYMLNTGLASAIETISVEVYNEEGTPVLWRRVESLEHVGRDALVYELQPLHDGTVLVRFGDGKHGACPPEARTGVRLRYLSGVGGEGQSATLRIGTKPLAAGGSVDWAQGTVWDESAEVLREHAAERVFEVITLRKTEGGSTRITLYEVPGRSLDAFLADRGDWLAGDETVVSVGVAD